MADTMNVRAMHQQNRQAWNEGAARYEEQVEQDRGRLHVFEGHPLAWIFDVAAADIRLDPVYGDYFAETVDVGAGWPGTYIGELDRPEEELTPKYERQWTLGQIINPLIETGLRLERFDEHPDPCWEQFPNTPEEMARRVPQTFSLLMRKE